MVTCEITTLMKYKAYENKYTHIYHMWNLITIYYKAKLKWK